jgi:hypothetical protein
MRSPEEIRNNILRRLGELRAKDILEESQSTILETQRRASNVQPVVSDQVIGTVGGTAVTIDPAVREALQRQAVQQDVQSIAQRERAVAEKAYATEAMSEITGYPPRLEEIPPPVHREGYKRGALQTVVDYASRPLSTVTGAQKALLEGKGLGGALEEAKRGLTGEQKTNYAAVLEAAGVPPGEIVRLFAPEEYEEVPPRQPSLEPPRFGLIGGPGSEKQILAEPARVTPQVRQEAKGVPVTLRGAAGLAGDIVLDPLTYVSFGTGRAVQLASGLKLSRDGEKLFGALMAQGMPRAAAEAAIEGAVANGGRNLVAQGGAYFAGRHIPGTQIPGQVASEVAGRVGQAVGSTERGKQLINAIDDVRAVFDRDARVRGFPQFMRDKQRYFNATGSDAQDIAREADEIFQGISREGEVAITHAIEAGPQVVAALPDPLRIAAERVQASQDALRQWEIQSGLGETYRDDYMMHAYTNYPKVKNAPGPGGSVNPNLQANRERVIPTLQEAKDLGLIPVSESARDLFILRSVASSRVRRSRELIDQAARNYGTKQLPDETGSEFFRRRIADELVELPYYRDAEEQALYVPRAIVEDMNNIGAAGLRRASVMIRAFDKLQNLWKGTVTSWAPAFHVRNAFSNAVLSAMDISVQALNPLRHARTVRILRGDEGEILSKFGERYPYAQVRRLYQEHGLGGAFGGRLGLSNEGRPWLGDYSPIAAGKKFGEGVEAQARMLHFTTLLERGFDPETAAARVKQYLFDYDNLSRTEREILRRAFPFYTFSRKNIEAQVRNLATEPGRQAAWLKLFTIPGNTEDTEAMKRDLPDYIAHGLAIPLGKDQEGQDMILWGAGLPQEEIARLFPQVREGKGRGQEFLRKNILQMLTPMAKVIMDEVTGRDVYLDRPIEEVNRIYDVYGKALEQMPEEVQKFLEFNREYDRRGNVRYTMNPHMLHLVRSFVLSRLYSTIGKQYDPRKDLTTQMLNTLTGLNIGSVDWEMQTLPAWRQRADERLQTIGRKEQQQNLRMLLEQGGTPPSEEEPQSSLEPTVGQKAVVYGAGIALPILGSIAGGLSPMPGGAFAGAMAGGNLANLIGQKVMRPGEPINWKENVVQTVASAPVALPVPAGILGRMAVRGLEGAGINTIAEGAQQYWAEGKPLSEIDTDRLKTAAKWGGVLGAGTGAVEPQLATLLQRGRKGGPPPEMPPEAPETPPQVAQEYIERPVEPRLENAPEGPPGSLEGKPVTAETLESEFGLPPEQAKESAVLLEAMDLDEETLRQHGMGFNVTRGGEPEENALYQLTPKFRTQMEQELADGTAEFPEAYRQALKWQDKLDAEPRVWKWNPEKKWFEEPEGYRKSTDPDSLCQRSEGTDLALRWLKTELGDDYSPAVGWEIISRSNRAGLQTGCPQCYVVSMRTAQGNEGSMQKVVLEGVGGYSGDITRFGDTTMDLLSKIGVRKYSFTDFKIEHLAGLIAEMVDAWKRKLPWGGYTKQPDFVEIFAPSGAHINMSVSRDRLTGMSMATALRLKSKHPNTAIVYIAFTDDEVLKALRNPNIDHVIPWHSSGQPVEELRVRLGDPNVKDYTKQQWDAEVSYSKKGEKIRTKSADHVADYEHKGDLKTYLRLVKERGLEKRFPDIYDQLDPNEKELYMKLVGPEYGKHGGKYPYAIPDPNKINYDAIPLAMQHRLATINSREKYLEIARDIAKEVKAGAFKHTRQELLQILPARSKTLLQRTTDLDRDYLAAVKRGDMETAQRMVDEAAERAGSPPQLDDVGVEAYQVRRKPAPKKTIKAYKLFVTRNGKLYPLFVGADEPIPQGVWLDGTVGPEGPPTKTGRPTVKAKLRGLGKYPGWHAGELPYAPQMGTQGPTGKQIQGNRVFAEVEMMADVDYQPRVDANGGVRLRELPVDGAYRAKTSSFQEDPWVISGAMKINRVLSEDEVAQILRASGKRPVPWKGGPLDLGKKGLSTDPAVNRAKLRDPVTYDDQGNVIPLSERFNLESEDVRYQGAKGSVEFSLDDTHALMRALKGADVSTSIHEISHVARRFLFDRTIPAARRIGITDEDIRIAEEWAGAKDGVWDVKAEEKWARGFERYMRDGIAPSKQLEATFAKFRQWLIEIYQRLRGSDIDVEISPEMREVFDRLVTRRERRLGTLEGLVGQSPSRRTSARQEAPGPSASGG